MSLDGSIIDLSVSMFDWAKFRRTKGAIKLHLLLDHDGYLPSFAVVTEGKTSEIKVARTLRWEPGTILAIDRGYVDYEWFRELTAKGVYFVTRMKEKAVYEVRQELQEPQNSNVVSDQIICFPATTVLLPGSLGLAERSVSGPTGASWRTRRYAAACRHVVGGVEQQKNASKAAILISGGE